MMNTNSISLWFLAIVPGGLHPLLLFVFFRRYGERKRLIDSLLNRSANVVGNEVRRHAGAKQKEQWQGNLNLDLPGYMFPTLITSALTIAAMIVILGIDDKASALGLPPSIRSLILLAAPATLAGFAGAFVWGLYDFVDRFRTLSLPPAALHVIWFRLILGAVLGAYAQQLLNKDFAPVFVFALGAIPVPAIIKWLQDLADKRFSIGLQTAGAAAGWELVQGLTPDIVSRLNEAGVTSVAHLGNQDPVSLLRKTNIEWRNILDMMDQAYLAIYVGTNIEKLRLMGIRGAIEMAILWQRIHSSDISLRSDAQQTVKDIADLLQVQEGEIRNIIQNLWEEPQVGRIWALWWNDEREQFTFGVHDRESFSYPESNKALANMP